MTLYDQVKLLCQAMNTQAQGEVETILTQAKAEADRRLSEAEARRQEALARTKAEVEAQARLEARSRIDRAELEGKRRISQTKETWLTEVFGQAQARLQAFRETPGYRDWLRDARCTPAVGRRSVRVMANPEEEKWLTPDLLEEVSPRPGLPTRLGRRPRPAPGGWWWSGPTAGCPVDQTFRASWTAREEP